MQPFEKYNWIYKGHVNNPNEALIFLEKLETRSIRFNWNIKPHIHPGIVQLFFIKKGDINLQTAYKKHQINSPCLLIIPPAVVHGFQYSNNSIGNILSISSTITDEIITKYENLVPLFMDLETISLKDNIEEHNRIELLYEFINNEQNNTSIEQQGMIQSLLQELFIVILRLWTRNQDLKTDKTDFRSLQYFRKFQYCIRNSGNKTTVEQIAKKIGITPVHLNRICNQSANKSARKLINEYLIIKAKNYLVYSSYSISEIAYFLNFEYPNYFSRFFKKNTGVSPAEYRKRFVENK